LQSDIKFLIQVDTFDFSQDLPKGRTNPDLPSQYSLRLFELSVMLINSTFEEEPRTFMKTGFKIF